MLELQEINHIALIGSLLQQMCVYLVVAYLLSKTPLFKPMERFVISLEGDREPHYLVLELALVTHNPQQLETLNELTPLIRNAMVQYFSHRSHEAVKQELQNISALQTSLLGKLVGTLEGYGYKPYLDEVLVTKVLVQ